MLKANDVKINWTKIKDIQMNDKNLIPVVIQDFRSKELLIIAYTDKIAFLETLASEEVVLWSTSRNELWRKGESSGNKLIIKDIKVNC